MKNAKQILAGFAELAESLDGINSLKDLNKQIDNAKAIVAKSRAEILSADEDAKAAKARAKKAQAEASAVISDAKQKADEIIKDGKDAAIAIQSESEVALADAKAIQANARKAVLAEEKKVKALIKAQDDEQAKLDGIRAQIAKLAAV